MAQGIVVDISARVTGYEQSLRQLQEAFKKVNPGTAMGKDIARALENAESKIKNLGKNLTPKITSDNQLERLTEKVNSTGDAILKVDKLMHNLTSEDINFDNFGDSIKNLTQQIQALEAQLGQKLEHDFQELLNTSDDLAKAFQKLDLNVSGKSTGEVFEMLSQKSKDAVKDVAAASKELSKAQQKLVNEQDTLNKLNNSPLAGADAIKQKIEATAKNIADGLDWNKLKSIIENNIQGFTQIDANKKKELVAAFTGGLDSDSLRTHLQNLKDSLIQYFPTLNASEIYKRILGDGFKGSNASSLEWSIKSQLFKTDDLKEAFAEQIRNLYSELNGTQIGKLEGLLNEDDINGALQASLKFLKDAYNQYTGEVIKQKQKVAEAIQGRDAAQGKFDQADQTRKESQSLFDNLTSQIQQLKQSNESLQNQIDELKKQRDTEKEEKAEQLKKESEGAIKPTNYFKISRGEAEKYNEELDKVHKKEEMVGRIEGVVQRWFSVYAAVRMVSNAIRSMISTIQELDKTITNIAIVTDMSQADLWAQMPQYTAMAHDYAVSISGVYEVSQLFYQQGLQTADVMKLTGETLKMARIAGIDYTEATNYMTNALRSFKMEMQDAGKVTDVYSALAASSATSVSELAEAMSKTASSAQSVGSSLENTASMIAVMTEATRESASNIGSALKSIISRYGEMKASPNDLIDVDGETASLNKVDTALQSVGITIKDANGQFRNFDDVIMELASVWDTLDNNTQRYIATIMAFLCIKRRLVM